MCGKNKAADAPAPGALPAAGGTSQCRPPRPSDQTLTPQTLTPQTLTPQTGPTAPAVETQPGRARSAACARGRRGAVLAKRHDRAAAGEDAVVAREVAEEFEMRRQPRLGEHPPGVAADRELAAGLDEVVGVEGERLLRALDRAAITHGLTIVFAGWLQAVEIEEPIGRREEGDPSKLFLQRGVIHPERTIGDKAGIAEAGRFCEFQKIALVERPAQAFAVQHGIAPQRFRNPPRSVDIGKIHLAARLHEPLDALEQRLLVVE